MSVSVLFLLRVKQNEYEELRQVCSSHIPVRTSTDNYLITVFDNWQGESAVCSVPTEVVVLK